MITLCPNLYTLFQSNVSSTANCLFYHSFSKFHIESHPDNMYNPQQIRLQGQFLGLTSIHSRILLLVYFIIPKLIHFLLLEHILIACSLLGSQHCLFSSIHCPPLRNLFLDQYHLIKFPVKDSSFSINKKKY